MRYLSLFSGIEAASVAWKPLGWQPVAFAETDPYASCVLRHRYPDVPNLGDVERFQEWPDDLAPDLIVGGSPCQAFSVAGLRQGLADPRGNLALVFVSIVARYRPRWVLWENVPGVLSSNKGRDFAALIGALAEIGYGFAWRVLDAQYIRVDGFCRAVPQRRRRVFLVGHSSGSSDRCATVLLVGESSKGNPPPRRETQRRHAGHSAPRPGAGGGRRILTPEISSTLTAHMGLTTGTIGPGGKTAVIETHASEVSNTLTERMHKGVNSDLREGQTPITYVMNIRQNTIHSKDVSMPLATYGDNFAVFIPDAVGFNARQNPAPHDVCGALDAKATQAVLTPQFKVRRPTPLECERLQGFPDYYTLLPGPNGKPLSDSRRYRLIGNSMAVNVMRWIGTRMQIFDV